jgi:integrase
VLTWQFWWGRWDLNPGPPTPQAGILNHSRRELMEKATVIPASRLLDDDPQTTKNENLIINTIITAKSNGKADNTLKSISKVLIQLSKRTNLSKPEEVKQYIANAKKEKDDTQDVSNATKAKWTFAYDQLCKANNLTWIKPRYKVPEGMPIIPTTENVNKIICASTKRYSLIFTLLAEIAAEGEELHKTHRSKINTETGEITIIGTKGHGSGTYKLKTRTAEMLREYIRNNPQEYPFPRPKIMSQIWQEVRNRVAENLNQPELRYIPMKNLRNYAGAIFYKTHERCAISTMRFMRHKKLETTMHYLRAINLDEPTEYDTRAIKLGEPDTQKLIIEYSNAGYQKLTDADGYIYMRIRKNG